MNSRALVSAVAVVLFGAAAPVHAVPDAAPPPVSTDTSADTELAIRLAYNVGFEEFEAARAADAAAATLTGAKRRAAEEKVQAGFRSARARFEEVVKIDPSRKEAWNLVGYTARRLGDYDASLAAYEKALALQPDYPEAIEYRGEAFLALNRVDDAKAAYLTLFASARGHADLLMQAMQRWVADRRRSPAGVAKADVDAFAAWIAERSAVAQQTASLAPGHVVPPAWF
jgi:tetratricopeptide (TPR) repeat protein